MVNSERNRIDGLDAQRVNNCLTDLRDRMYRQALLQTVTFTFFCGLILLAILFLLNRVMLLPMQMLNISWSVMSVAVVIGICLSVKHRKDLPFVARVVDEKMQLSERLSTALGVIQTDPQSEFLATPSPGRCRDGNLLRHLKGESVLCAKDTEVVSNSTTADWKFLRDFTLL